MSVHALIRTPWSRVAGWRRVEDAWAGRPPDLVLGEKDLQDTIPEIGRDKLAVEELVQP